MSPVNGGNYTYLQLHALPTSGRPTRGALGMGRRKGLLRDEWSHLAPSNLETPAIRQQTLSVWQEMPLLLSQTEPPWAAWALPAQTANPEAGFSVRGAESSPWVRQCRPGELESSKWVHLTGAPSPEDQPANAHGQSNREVVRGLQIQKDRHPPGGWKGYWQMHQEGGRGTKTQSQAVRTRHSGVCAGKWARGRPCGSATPNR